MQINVVGDISHINAGLKELQVDYKFELSSQAPIEITAIEQADQGEISVQYNHPKGSITFSEPHQFFRGFGQLLEKVREEATTFDLKEEQQFKTVGPMFDVSRNSPMNEASFKELIRMMAMMGFNSAMIYMEDTYEVEGEPYFGYMRGRYSEAELRAFDDYAHQFGIELIPCIQTLAHLEEFLKWEPVRHYKDTRGALLLESEPTYELLEKMIGAASRPFRSKRIHIGMDEAEELGRGIFLNKNGYTSRVDLMTTHLDRVLKMTDDLGLDAMMWSDMFLKLASDTGDIYSADTEIPQEIIDQTPEQIQLMYWQYNSTDIEHYRQIIAKHKAFGKKPAFAGGIWVWNTFATNYEMSLQASNVALEACKEADMDDVFVTLWGDDGFENNYYSALYGLQFYAEHMYARTLDEEKLTSRVLFCTGVTAEKFLMLNELDTPPGVAEGSVEQTNPSKFLLWQDALLGVFDKHIEGLEVNAYYEQLAEKFASAREETTNLDIFFEVPEKLCRVLALKAELGLKLKAAYDNKDEEELNVLANVQIPEVITRVRALRQAHRKQWMQTRKAFGWEVIDIRYGGLVNRLESAMDRVNDYIQNDIEAIEELAQERLYYGGNIEESTGLGWCSYYYRMATPNVFFHVLPIY